MTATAPHTLEVHSVAAARAAALHMPFTCGPATFPTQARHRGWLSNAAVCAWQLVGCDEEQRVKSLSLDYTSLRGTLPASLGALRRLEALDLEGNFLSGTVPSYVETSRPEASTVGPPARPAST